MLHLVLATKEILWVAGRDIPSLDDFLEGRADLVDDASEDMQVEFDEIEIKSGTEHSVRTTLSLAPTLAGSISESAPSRNSNDAEIMIKSYPFISYSTKYRLDHAELAERNSISQGDLLNYFRWPSDQILRRWIRVRQHVFSDRSEAGLTLMHIAANVGF